ncbi:MAG: sulfite exporter TauE/SafE family protein [Chloroflexi bacterium]|nr:sulfite exporter TauE/SafE family protein [Chloroflexota bacterium]
MSTDLLVALIVFLAILAQTTTGFGLALVSMPLLTAVIGLTTAAPLVALFGVLAEIIILLRYREAVYIRPVVKLVVSAFVGIPLGLWLLQVVDPEIGAHALGVLVAGYALYALFNFRLPPLARSVWAYLFGFAAGALGGLYNTAGPPVIIYGSCRQWSPATFKGNLQGFFVPVSLMILVGHVVDGNVTAAVWRLLLVSIPAVGLGLLVGFALDGRIPAATFRKIVLALLLVIGLRLTIS